jgi:hypothetical protein
VAQQEVAEHPAAQASEVFCDRTDELLILAGVVRSARLRTRSAVIAAFTALASTSAVAQDARIDGAPNDPAVQTPLGDLRLRYGPTFRSGNYLDNNPNLTYSGMTPNDLALGAAYFPFIVGGDLKVQREGFSLNDGSTKVTSGSLTRFAVGPAVRAALGPVKLDGMVNYAYAELPGFLSSATPVFTPAKRQSVMIAARGRFELPAGVLAEVAGEFPIAFSTKDDSGQSAKSSGFAAGASLGYRVYASDRLAYLALADYQYVSDSLTAANGNTASQTLHRVGLALELDYLEPPVPRIPRTGGLVVTVLDETTQAPIPNASVDLEAGAQRYTLTTSANGQATQTSLPLGAVTAKAAFGGYLSGQSTGQVQAGEDAQVRLLLKKEPPKVGSLAVSFVDKENQQPLAGVRVVVRDQEYVSDEGGALALADLTPGPLEVKATKEGYRPGSEVATVVAGQKSPLVVALVKAERKEPATVKGLVRATQTGAPLAATLEIPEAKVKVKADAQGSFTVPLPRGGTYRVIISAPGYITQSKSVVVKEGDAVIFNVDLHPVGR